MQPENMLRTILYYPTIDVPNGRWLRQALLYWDQVASIVPRKFEEIPEDKRYSDEIRDLYSQELFRPLDPSQWHMNQPSAVTQSFEEEFKAHLDDPDFQKLIAPEGDRVLSSEVYPEKVNWSLFAFLEGRKLVEQRDEFYYFEPHTALLYMSILAKYLADADHQPTTPGTDLEDYNSFNYRAAPGKEGVPCVETRYANLLPVPREDVSLGEIIDFKERRHGHLLKFRQAIDGIQSDLRTVESRSAVKDVLVTHQENITNGVNDLRAVLEDDKLATLTGTLKAIFKLDVAKGLIVGAGLAGATGAAALLGGPLAAVPVMAVGAIAGAVEVFDFRVGKRNEERERLRDSIYSYVYLAQEEQIV